MKLELIETIENNLKQEISKQIEENKNNEIDNYDEINQIIKFKKDMKIGEALISKNELNFILEFCFYFRESGYKAAPPNLAPENNVQLKTEDENIKRVDNILNDGEINESKKVSLEKKIKMEVKSKMIKIKEEIMNYFMKLSTKKELELSEILQFMFFGQTNNMWLGQSTFLLILQRDISNIINEEYDLNLSTYIEDMKKLQNSKDILDKLNKEDIVKKFSLDRYK